MAESSRLRIPIFPLPEVFFLPETLLPLHVFEPRYRALVADAWVTDRRIGMIAWAPGAAAEPEPKPLRPIGCAGEIVHLEPLEDGRSNILLRGLFCFRIEREEPHAPYRIVRGEPLAAAPLAASPEARASRRKSLGAAFAKLVASMTPDEEVPTFSESVPDEGVVHQIAMALSPRAEEAAALLAMRSLAERADWAEAKMSSLQTRLDLLAPFRPKELRPESN